MEAHKRVVLRSTHFVNKGRTLKLMFDAKLLLLDSPGSGRFGFGSGVLLGFHTPCCSPPRMDIVLLLLCLHLGLYVVL